jgi:hypothetical protein
MAGSSRDSIREYMRWPMIEYLQNGETFIHSARGAEQTVHMLAMPSRAAWRTHGFTSLQQAANP